MPMVLIFIGVSVLYRVRSTASSILRRTISLRLELAGLRKDVALVHEQFQVSERRACKLLGVDRSTYRYEPRPDHNADLREELVTLARQKPRYGYRRLHVLLERR